MAIKVPQAGVWTPAVTFFAPTTGSIDLEAQKQYFAYLSKHVTGLVILGSNAEAFLLTREERISLVKAARSAVGPTYPLIVGISGYSTIQTLEYAQDAKSAGADFGLLLPASYYGAATSKEVVNAFFDEVAQGTDLPIVIYNFPGQCNGVDLDSVTIAGIVKRNPGKVVGVKLTCGSVAKVTRLTAELSPEEFTTFGGQSDFLIGGLAVGSQGCVAAFSNVFPKTIKKVYDLYVAGKVDCASALP
ncbi:dihydrodipicolinate synthetase [Paraphaeosphaeria minitans]|uniref:Dihydrodipicolinate synthetase n=1 Tax=Paraphaeosphaeria minitans TaxID=565426 RepID=A0A9P6GKZ3_9PLEO|nr:dihydrodipicolinate synthetase [Paraphaeosphaeria minitans]